MVNQEVLEIFERSLLRNKDKDIISNNPYKRDIKFERELFNYMFYEKLKVIFDKYMSDKNIED